MNLKAALFYLKMGLSVIPVIPGQKKPLISWQEFQERRATEEEVKEWFKNTPNANIGIVTGPISNLAVVDIDTEEGKGAILDYISDSIECPTVETPRGGQHLYFSYPENFDVGNNARLIPGCDFRGRGGYVIAPPSVNSNGKAYRWVIKFRGQHMPLPEAYINKINKSTLYTGSNTPVLQSVTPVTSCDIFGVGRRDDNLFHIANCLARTKNNDDYIRQTLRAIMLSWGESDEKWIDDKIQSVIKRAERKERNIQAEVEEFISVTSGYFSVTECYQSLQIVTSCDKGAVRKALNRLKDKKIEKFGQKDGVYRRIDTEIKHIDFNAEEGATYPVLLPLDLHELVNICEGNIILVSGEYNAGKSTFALNALQMNKNRLRIRYISSEMKAGEFRARWRTFPMPEDFWLPDEMTEYVELGNNLPALILPDGLNIVDYLEFRDGDYTQGAEYMRQIHDRLTTGVAIVCNQQKEGCRLPRSGDLIMEKPRLAIGLHKVSTENDQVVGDCIIQKAKNVKLGKADGKKLRYEITERGSRFKVLTNWGWWK